MGVSIRSINQLTLPYRKGSDLMDTPHSSRFTVHDFMQWREQGTLILSPKFQRRSVWSPKQRSFFVDTMIREMPSPPIYLRNIYDLKPQAVVHEVVDGQQRLGAVLDFVDGGFSLSKSLGKTDKEAPHRGKKFDKLTKEERLAIFKYKFHCESFDAIADAEVFEVFRRMNTYSTPLSKQELRHGNYFGFFSQLSEHLALQYHGFIETILTPGRIARMLDVQLVSALLASQIDGPQDKNDSLDDFYDSYDDEFAAMDLHEKRFCQTVDRIIEIFGDTLTETHFSKPAFFYTLFGAVYHRWFGMPKVELNSPKKPLTEEEARALKSAVLRLSEMIDVERTRQKLTRDPEKAEQEVRKMTPYPRRFAKFIVACTQQTDNINPRKVRLSTLYNESFH